MHPRSLLLAALTAAVLTTVTAAQELDPSRKLPSPLADVGSEARIIVKLRPGDASGALEFKPRNTLESVASRSGFKPKATVALGAGLHVMEIERAAGEPIETTLARLNADSAVEYAEIDRRHYLHAAPDDLLYSQQWYLQAPGVAPSAIDAEHAWDVTTGSQDVVVAFLTILGRH